MVPEKEQLADWLNIVNSGFLRKPRKHKVTIYQKYDTMNTYVLS